MIDINVIEKILLKLGKEHRLTDEENNILSKWCAEADDNQKLADFFRNGNALRALLAEMKEIPSQSMWKDICKTLGIDQKIAAEKRKRKMRLVRYILLGLLLAAILISYYCRLVH